MRLADALATARLVAGIPRFLRRPVDPVEARATVARRRRERVADFLALVGTAVYAQAHSPYRALLAHAGCAYGDLVTLVEREGLHGALSALHRAGVYVTVEELKGRRPIVRGSLTLAPDPGRFHNVRVAPHELARTSGSRGTPTAVPLSLDFLGDATVDMRLTLDAWGPGPWSLAYWDAPGATPFFLLTYARCGVVPGRWFSLVDVTDPRIAGRYRWSARVFRGVSRAAGVRLPSPETTPVDAPLPIARWMAASLSAGRTPLLLTYPSPAVRLCRAAVDAGIDLTGAELRLYGEPLTPARLDAIRRSGAEARTVYATMDAWRVAEACLHPEAADEVHLLDDLHALVQPDPDDAGPGLSPRSLLLTSLRPTAPVILLNASLGDEAVITSRRCGCPLEDLGWTTHLSGIRSYEKLTAAGMTFLDTDVMRVLDETLPARFGGGPTDYQLVEDEAVDGGPRIRLLVHPVVGPLDPAVVSRVFLEAIGAGAGTPAVMARIWADAGTVMMERRPPMATASGKILHVHTGGPRDAPSATRGR